MPYLVYLIGEPGIGKSTLMEELTAGWRRTHVAPSPGAPARDVLIERDPDDSVSSSRIVAVELGRRRGAFSGTDALPQTVIGDAVAYLASGQAEAETGLLLAEGARLANMRFLRAARDSGWAVVVLYLFGGRVAAAQRAARTFRLGTDPQNASWVKGRATAARNLANLCEEEPGITVVPIDVERVHQDETGPYALSTVAEVRRAFSEARP